MLNELFDSIGGKDLYIYGEGPRGRMLISYLESSRHMVPKGIVVSDGYRLAESYTTEKGSRIKIFEFGEIKSAIPKTDGIYFINTVNENGEKTIVAAIDQYMTGGGGERCYDMTDEANAETHIELLAGFMKGLGADINDEVLTFKGMRYFNPVSLTKHNLGLMFPAVGDVILPGLYGNMNYIHLGPYEQDGITVEPGGVVLDIGANMGVFTCYAASKGCRVYAFDPNDEVLPVLERQRALYPDRITVIPKGLSDSEGTATFNRANEPASSSLVMPLGTSTVQIEITTLDAFAKKEGLDRIDLVKLDVMGAERMVLAGAMETLRKFKPMMSIHIYTHFHENELENVTKMIKAIDPRYEVTYHDPKLFAKIADR